MPGLNMVEPPNVFYIVDSKLFELFNQTLSTISILLRYNMGQQK